MSHVKIEVFRHKAFDTSLHELKRAGGEKNRRAEKVFAMLGRLHLGAAAIEGAVITNHGESRIKHCVKYDIGGGFRLVTVQTDRMLGLLYVGSHDDTDRWLDSHSGLTISKGSGGSWEAIFQSPSVDSPIRRDPVGGHTRPLLDRLPQEAVDQLLDGVSASVIGKLVLLTTGVSPVEIETLCSRIGDVARRSLVYDVLCLLVSGNHAAAQSRLDLSLGAAQDIDDLADEDILDVQDGDTIRRVVIGSPEHGAWLSAFSRSATSLEWLLFLHPEQKTVVDRDFSGPSQLSGVSGSGKTCVAIHRALRLAAATPGAPILIVTLNRSLAGLIRSMVDGAAPPEDVRSSISIKSFFQVCQELLARLEPGSERRYSDVTWKLDEHIDEVFREYYRCWANNRAAENLLPVHHSLIAQGVCAETYVREEFDWIRSAVPTGSRHDYLTMDRRGRRIGLQQDARTLMLQGLADWEEKMEAVGVIDYLGLTAAVSRYLERIEPAYDHILIDEAQDFGTSELRLLRRLCKPGPNDLFLCGDIAQHVLPKHRSLVDAGIGTSGNSCRIVRNYRNSREILEAAYGVLMENLDEQMLDSGDLEILDPTYASRSSSAPVVLEAGSLDEEIGYARSLAKEHLEAKPKHRCCIAFAGYSIREVAHFAERFGVPVLRGEQGPLDEPLVMSDLEQTKGYEFNLVVIVNCREGVLPPEGTAPDEAYRHGCRLYVAMTRARDELVLSYAGEPTRWLSKASTFLTFMSWGDVVTLDPSLVAPPPERLKEAEPDHAKALGLKGRDFLYTPAARGLSVEAVRKIDELVDGVGLIRGKTRVRWRNMETLLQDLESSSRAQQSFGPVLHREVRDRLERLQGA
jgi:hypothetical protein